MADKDAASNGAGTAGEESGNTSSRDGTDDQTEGFESSPKAPVRYHLTLKARDLYLLIFGAALVIFAAFTLGAIVGRYMGPYPDQKVAAQIERKELFEEGQEFVVKSPYQPPEGFCQWAWADIRQFILGVYFGWEDAVVACCTDGFRPVIFKLERDA